MIFLVALREFGAGGAVVLGRPSTPGSVIRVGDSAGADMRLPGAGVAAADLLCTGSTWCIRRRDGPVASCHDGETFGAGPWIMIVVVSPDDGAGPIDLPELDAPTLCAADGEPIAIARGTASLIGASACCPIRSAAIRIPVAAIVCRNAGARATLYAIPGVRLRIGRERLNHPRPLTDGDEISIGDEGHATLVYADPREQLDRLLGHFRAPTTTPPPSRRLREAFSGERPFVTPLEAALWLAGAVALIGYAVVVVVRW